MNTDCCGQSVRVTALIAVWFCCNIGVLLLNKALLSSYGFGYPVFLTALHVRLPPVRRALPCAPDRPPRPRAQMAACTALSSAAVRGLRLVPYEPLRSARHTRRVALLSAVFCASVVAGNVSLRFIPVSFNQAVSATDPAFTALFAAALLRKREARATYLALVPIVAGTALASGVRRASRSVQVRRLLTLRAPLRAAV
jgi:hypothetical protein